MQAYENAKWLIVTLQETGHEAVFAGGCVRDICRGVLPNDYDIATSMKPDEVQSLFENMGFKVLEVGKSFGVVRVVYNGEEYEIATFRKDGPYTDGRRPDSVRLLSSDCPQAIFLDSQRRDVTFNSMFLDPISGIVYDPNSGRKDLLSGVVRFVGNPYERIKEDSLRMLRAIRFAVTLDFKLDPLVSDAICKMAPRIKLVSNERIRDELNKILTCSDAARGFELLRELGLWKEIVPEIAALWDCEQDPIWHPEGSVGNHTSIMLSLSKKGKLNTVIAWGIILHDIGKPATSKMVDGHIRSHGHDRVGADIARSILNRLRFDRDTINKIVALVYNHMQFMAVTQMKRSTLMKMIGRETINDELELHRVDCLSCGAIELRNYNFVQNFISELEPEEIEPEWFVTGKDLIDLGLKPSRQLGGLLEILHDEQLEGSFRDRKDALSVARAKIREIF